MTSSHFDIAVLGGGLAGGLAALALARLRPDLRVAVIEAGGRFGGNHIWSFFATDIAGDDAWLVEPLIAARWDQGYDVRFPRYRRTLSTPYRSITSDSLDAALRIALPPEACLTGRQVVAATATSVTLADGGVMDVGAVIDARGAAGFPGMTGGWQKFVGHKLRLAAPHGLARPVVMDAAVAQHDGFRFVYCLPFAPDVVFVEDTYYANGPDIDNAVLDARIADYCRQQGWHVAEVLRRESGVLPVIGTGDFDRLWPAGDDGPARAGARAGLLHPLTSYSLPDAVRFARFVARQPDLSGAALAGVTRAYARSHWQEGLFYRTLSRMMFGAARTDSRYRVLEHFYRKPVSMIEHFYAGSSTGFDKLRLFIGRPPVPIARAAAVIGGGGYPLASLENL